MTSCTPMCRNSVVTRQAPVQDAGNDQVQQDQQHKQDKGEVAHAGRATMLVQRQQRQQRNSGNDARTCGQGLVACCKSNKEATKARRYKVLKGQE
jgi:hypothetical protein